MKTGSCVKCSAKTVYFSDERYPKNGFRTADDTPRLNINKAGGWIPDIKSSQMNYYVCKSCGYLEMFVQDLSVLEKLDDCDNWKKIEEN